MVHVPFSYAAVGLLVMPAVYKASGLWAFRADAEIWDKDMICLSTVSSIPFYSGPKFLLVISLFQKLIVSKIFKARNGLRTSSNLRQKLGSMAKLKKWRKRYHDKRKRKQKIIIWSQQIQKQSTQESRKSIDKQKGYPPHSTKKFHPFLPSGKNKHTITKMLRYWSTILNLQS